MTEEVAVQEEQAAFEAGFNAEPVELPPAQEQEQEPAPTEEAAPEAAAEPEPERNQWGYTDEEMKSLLSKVAKVDQLEQQLEQERQKIYGKLGEYNRTIQQMQSSNKGGSLTVRQLSHLRGEFPELADLLEKDFGEAQPVAAPQQHEEPAPAFDPRVIDERVASATLGVKLEMLDVQHPDWREVKDSQEFGTWVGLQSPEKQQQINASQDLRFVISSLNEFKSWREKTQAASTKKTARLERAVAPTGVANSGPPAIDEEEAFVMGFKSRGGF